MTPFIIKNEQLTKVMKLLGKEFNKFDFAYWVNGFNPEFSLNKNSDMLRYELDNYFVGKGEHSKVKNIPNFEVNNIEQLRKFIAYPHGIQREAVISVLAEDFGIDYWQEVLSLCCDKSESKKHNMTIQLLAHSVNDFDFTNKNINPLKDLIEEFIDFKNKSKNKHYTDVLQYLSFSIANKELFGNKWIINNLDKIFADPNEGSAKQFNFVLDKVSKQFIDLDFSNIEIGTGFKKIIKGKLPLRKTVSCIPYFWQIDFSRYSMSNRVVQSILQTNCNLGLPIINKFLEAQPEVLSSSLKKEKNLMTLSVLHEDPKLNAKIELFLNIILEKTAINAMVEERDLERSLLFADLTDKFSDNKKQEKRTKI
jgi:hypothetical protein